MKTEYLNYDEQRLIVEDLYNIDDSIEACRRLENESGIQIREGRLVKLNDFAKALKKTKFHSWEIEKAILKQTGHKVDLEKLDSNSWF